MKRLLVLFSVMIMSVTFFSAGSCFAGTFTQWEMVYDHDSIGAALNNTNINDLKTATLNGSDIKVIMHMGSGKIHHSIKLNKVRVETATDGTLVSIIGFYDGTAPMPGGQMSNGVYDNAGGVVIRLQSFSTNGQYISYYPSSASVSSNISISNVPMTWYVSR